MEKTPKKGRKNKSALTKKDTKDIIKRKPYFKCPYIPIININYIKFIAFI